MRPVGSASPLAWGGERHAERTIAGACLGGFLGAILFLFADELFFSDSGSNVPIPGSPSARIMIRIFVTLLAAVGAAWGSVGKSAIPTAGAFLPMSPELPWARPGLRRLARSLAAVAMCRSAS